MKRMPIIASIAMMLAGCLSSAAQTQSWQGIHKIPASEAEAGYSDSYEYLSEGWFENIRRGVLEAKKRGLKVWIIDEGKYPSGFAVSRSGAPNRTVEIKDGEFTPKPLVHRGSMNNLPQEGTKPLKK